MARGSRRAQLALQLATGQTGAAKAKAKAKARAKAKAKPAKAKAGKAAGQAEPEGVMTFAVQQRERAHRRKLTHQAAAATVAGTPPKAGGAEDRDRADLFSPVATGAQGLAPWSTAERGRGPGSRSASDDDGAAEVHRPARGPGRTLTFEAGAATPTKAAAGLGVARSPMKLVRRRAAGSPGGGSRRVQAVETYRLPSQSPLGHLKRSLGRGSFGEPAGSAAAAGAPVAVGGHRGLGMLNPGNLCYINAAVAALFNLRTFVADLLALPVPAGPGAGPAGILAELQALARRFLRASSRRGLGGAGGSSGDPRELKRLIDARAAGFQGNAQQDAHEFLCFLLAGLQEECTASPVATPAAAPARATVELRDAACPATRNFGGTLQRTLTCGRCGFAAPPRTEFFLHLSLQVPHGHGRDAEPVPLEKILEDFFEDEAVEKTCDRCGAANAPHRQATRLRRLPRVLSLHLKRFRVSASGRPVKVQAPVRLPLDRLRLAKFCAADGALPPLPPPPGLGPDFDFDSADGGGPAAAAAFKTPGGGRTTPGGLGGGLGPLSRRLEQVATPRPETPETGAEVPRRAPVDIVDSESAGDGAAGPAAAAAYRLRAVVTHQSHVSSAGHFITDVLDHGGADPQVVTYNDTLVEARPAAAAAAVLAERARDCYVVELEHVGAAVAEGDAGGGGW